MVVRPVEMQGMVQRSQDITPIKQNQDNKPIVEQNNIYNTQQKQLHQKQENVIKKEDVDYHQEKYDAKEKGKNEYTGGKKQQKKNDNPDELGTVTLKKKKSGFDMSI